VQGTWLAMTGFGVLLRGVMPGIADPETGLSVFFQHNLGAIPTGIIAADVFATIAATSNGILIAMAQAANFDLFANLTGRRPTAFSIATTTIVVGAITMLISMGIHGTVVNMALSSVSLMGAGIAGAMIIKVFWWPHTAVSLLFSICAGILSAVIWKYTGMAASLNEAAIGIPIALGLTG